MWNRKFKKCSRPTSLEINAIHSRLTTGSPLQCLYPQYHLVTICEQTGSKLMSSVVPAVNQPSVEMEYSGAILSWLSNPLSMRHCMRFLGLS